ncbi:hypothetical protein [Synechococcus sp. CBW1107]|jgi:DNA/RNA-binding domain of Phe-tRNA-synthetase-like protein|uniref:hypothetical protein n=1 Tax=Synechococcus sp. CBW1107 TaxID=2789857 RepID=UPI002AD2BE63|nr:hypothetical protein [Synechococcus sp. CBW1107]CAK6689884.1 hypothetical protein MNNICLKF_00709 [Synechococcus sp. CBW1107]
MSTSTPSRTCACTTNQAAELQTALLEAITGLTKLVGQLAAQFPTKPAAVDAEPWMEERVTEVAQSSAPACTPNLNNLWDELTVEQLRNVLRDFPIDRSSLPAPIEYLRRSEVIEALNQIQAMGL